MLLTQEQVTRCMNLSTQDLCRAMERSGYGSEGVRCAEFQGVNSDGHYVYRYQFPDETGAWEFGRVYIQAKANETTGALELDVEY